MTRRLINLLACTALLSSLLSPMAGAALVAEEQILLIDRISGVAGVQRDGKRLTLSAGDALQEQDLIVTDDSGRMTLRLGRHGFVEVGPNAEVGVERLPFAAYARDLKSIFSVGKGYFRVVWKHPQQFSSWPLYVYMAGQRMSLTSGEYFFQHQGARQSACVAAGQIMLQAVASEGVETIKSPSCVQLAADAAPQIAPRDPDDWIAVRRGYRIEATAAVATAAVVAAAPAVAARPPSATTAAATVNASLPQPAPAPLAEASLAGSWSLNVASYSQPTAAEQEVARLRAAGYGSARTRPIELGGKTWHRVQIGGFASDGAARSAAQDLKQKLGLQNVWVLKP